MPQSLRLLNDLERSLEQTMLVDRHRLRSLAISVRQAYRRGQPFERSLERLQREMNRSLRQRDERRARVPPTSYNPELPITARRQDIAASIQAHQVVVVCGETGSGKSTQLPKICLDAGLGVEGMIGHTQPRRIAARSVAARIADELRSPVGRHVGFKIRFTDATSPDTYIKLMTDGILLAETQHDRFLEQYGAIIIDEAHERSLNIDFLLGYLKRLLPKRRDLRLIITSATLDVERFAQHFSSGGEPAPIIEVSGRMYPVEVRYRPLQPDEGDTERDTPSGITTALNELTHEGPGDILVFLPTERDIRDLTKILRGQWLGRSEKVELVPLYGRLSAAEQNKVFQLRAHRRIVMATNVAESSLTVPGIRYVIDTGTARISRYSPRSKVQRLPIEPVSQASADQRAGRCGRIAPGICLRLYSEEDYLRRDRFTTPEIRRTNLAAVILQMLALRLGPVDEFPFVDPPRADAVRDGFRTLFELRAIDNRRQLTDLGRSLSRLPVDPRIGRMVFAAEDEGCLSEVLIIASVLEIQDPRERPAEKEELADERHAQFAHADSDFLSYLQLWDVFHRWKKDLTRGQLRKACQQNFLSLTRMREWQDIHRQLRELVEAIGLLPGPRRDNAEAIHRALLAGLLSNIALRQEKYQYHGSDGGKCFLWPGSVAFGNRPRWVVAGELVETQRRYLRSVAPIQARWLERAAEHLVKRSYSDPFWSGKRGTVLALEKVTLFGLTIVAGRRIPYGSIDPLVSRSLFIRHALVQGDFGGRASFFLHNRHFVHDLYRLGAKSRRSDLFVSEEAQCKFYDQRLSEDVYDSATLGRWLRNATAQEVGRLHMRREDFLSAAAEDPPPEHFPDQIRAGELNLDVAYRFEPGEEDDGLTVTLPRDAINQLDMRRLDWMVPGVLAEKLTALIRSLPKSIRRQLVPATDTAKQAASLLRFSHGDFLEAAAAVLAQLAGEPISKHAFQPEKLPHFLRMNVRVVDATGRVIAQGRDIDALKQQLGVTTSLEGGVIRDAPWQREEIRTWDFGELPPRVELRRGAFTMHAFPALVDRREHVTLCLMDNEQAAARATRGGLRRLFSIAEQRELESHVHWLPRLNELQLFASTMRHRRDWTAQLADLLAQRAYVDSAPVPRSADEFKAHRTAGRKELLVVVQDVARLIQPLFETYHGVQCALDGASGWLRCEKALDDLRQQLARLIPEEFLVETPWQWLLHYPRYFRAMLVRLDKLQSGGRHRDAEAMSQLTPLLTRYEERRQLHAMRGICDPELDEFRWMLEEYRVSLFAQLLGTSIKVSPQRLKRHWEKVQ